MKCRGFQWKTRKTVEECLSRIHPSSIGSVSSITRGCIYERLKYAKKEFSNSLLAVLMILLDKYLVDFGFVFNVLPITIYHTSVLLTLLAIF